MQLLLHICRPPRFVDTRIRIWQILKSKQRSGRNVRRRGQGRIKKWPRPK